MYFLIDKYGKYSIIIFFIKIKSNTLICLIKKCINIIIFESLNKDVIYQILDKIISDINKRLDDKKITISLTKEAKDFVINNSYDEQYGARPIKRFVSRNIETLLAKAIVNEEIKYNSNITIDVQDDNLYIKK